MGEDKGKAPRSDGRAAACKKSGESKAASDKPQHSHAREKILEIHRVLKEMYPAPVSGLLEPKRENPIDVLVAVILSQATNDTLSDRAFESLKRAFPTWESVASADPALVEGALAAGGLQKEKTKKIQAALNKIQEDFGEISLDRLAGKSPRECFDYLVSLPGVGPKTAACVMAFGLNMPAFPVDTHVYRLSKRLGLVPREWNPVKTQDYLEDVTPDELKVPLHLLLIRHGREVCTSRKPKCSVCALRDLCGGEESSGTNLS
ncbi:MAG TPA: endonuclease III [Firmicutes bacterium]|nr:endonuclease III [Candidatus Fermentithermobacillaceae bacterium]